MTECYCTDTAMGTVSSDAKSKIKQQSIGICARRARSRRLQFDSGDDGENVVEYLYLF